MILAIAASLNLVFRAKNPPLEMQIPKFRRKTLNFISAQNKNIEVGA
jgi:hypothetical protein